MATRKSAPLVPHSANLGVMQMHEFMPRLKRRLNELENFTPGTTIDEVTRSISALEKKYDDTLVEVFGINSIEYQRYRSYGFYNSTEPLSYNFGGSATPTLEQEVASYRRGVATAARNLQTIIELFEEKICDSAGPTASPMRALENLHLHPHIADASVDLFKGGHYANAVEDACKVLDLLVKMKSKRDLSGTELMQIAFSPKAPVLRFNEQQNDSEKSEQQGMMYLYAGAMLAFRNPRAHGLLTDDPVEALEIIGFVNFLAKSLEKTKRA
ncbi:TIGR02391 family protein [Oxalobacteraceae bacterium OTU3CAMAD1]|nr:TIGR02391 family protein [Oxalobacteraceae bacterium OTU3CAMAD1]